MTRTSGMIPPHLMAGLMRYVDHGLMPGSFLRACLENKLVDAFSHADTISSGAVKHIARWLYNDAPSTCWGSAEKVEAWATRGGLKGHAPPPCAACSGTGHIVNAESKSSCPECHGEGVRRAAP